MKCSEWRLHIGFATVADRERCKTLEAAQPVIDASLGAGEKMLNAYRTSGRFIIGRCRLTSEMREKTGGSNGHSQKLLRLSKDIAAVFPNMTELEILGFYINDHRTCQWKWVFDAQTNTGRLSLIPVYLQNKMCTTGMNIELFSTYLADWVDRMRGHVIGDVE